MEKQSLDEALNALGAYLSDKGLKFEVVAIGGGALSTPGMHHSPYKRSGYSCSHKGQDTLSLPAPCRSRFKKQLTRSDLRTTFLGIGSTPHPQTYGPWAFLRGFRNA